jgi:hypothetical protein
VAGIYSVHLRVEWRSGGLCCFIGWNLLLLLLAEPIAAAALAGRPEPAPLLEALDAGGLRARVAELIQQIEATAAAERAKKGVEPLGVEKILAQEPETRPETLDRSPAPFVHAATRKIRKELWDAYGWFVAAYREAAEKLRNGDRNAAFPPGSFPPHLPFVPA